MSTARHTQSPWGVLERNGVHVVAEGGLTIATVAHQIDYAGIEGREQLQNARLIAAAPELLEALVELLKHNTPGDKERAVLAIKKATGSAA